MRVAYAMRRAGYPVVSIVLLVGLYCLLVGSDVAAGALGLAGTVLIIALAGIRRWMVHGGGIGGAQARR
jgi:hypothetical protein